MYIKEQNEFNKAWAVISPWAKLVVEGLTEAQADQLVSHLNSPEAEHCLPDGIDVSAIDG
jgi:hypothetical protein